MSKILFESLYQDTKIVASSRFNKAKRLARQTWWSLFSISFISITLVILTVCDSTMGIKNVNPIFMIEFTIPSWVFTLIASLITLALSIAISSSRLDVQYEKLYDSAIRINRVSREIESANLRMPLPYYDFYLNKYQDVLKESPVNHDDLDHIISKAIVKKEFGIKYYYYKYCLSHAELFVYYLITYVSFSVIISMLLAIGREFGE
ncbi:SLATT domain-containing protein [Shewanella xiamenensis]|uniref:SLATT domain-containing protein n=1 Tax=Shewanella xiamenensis TaxID=332186 RepID=UPI00313D4571